MEHEIRPLDVRMGNTLLTEMIQIFVSMAKILPPRFPLTPDVTLLGTCGRY